MSSANKVALNTGILYGRMLVTMGISLYSTRLILSALGSTDYGIFNLIAGVIAMLSFLNTAMATSTQRFLSFHQGKKDLPMQKKVFTNSLLLHVGIGLLIVLTLELVGLFLFNGFLNIPLDRIEQAKSVYHFMSVTVFFTIVSVPFTGSLVAHENMLWIAVVNVVETMLKLGIALLLLYISTDKLIIYGFLTASISVLSLFLYIYYCFRTYEDCTLENFTVVDIPVIKQLTSFAGWNLFGSLCGLGRSQGIAVLLNLFFGAVINAAYGIANQVAAQLNFFSSTMLRVLNPQIMKSEGANDRKRMLRLSMMASKFGFFLLAYFAIPCIFEMPAILSLWLRNVPEHTSIFCRLMLVGALVNQLTIGLQSAAQATGRIKAYQAVVGSVLLLNLPLAYFLLNNGYPAYSVLIGYAFIEAIACVLRVLFLKYLTGMSITEYVNRVFMREVVPVFLTVTACYFVSNYLESTYRFIFTTIVSVSVFSVSIYLSGLCKDEKEMFDRLFVKLKSTVFRGKSYASSK